MPGRPAGTGLLLERSAPGDGAIVVLFADGGETRGARGNGRPGRREAAGPGASGGRYSSTRPTTWPSGSANSAILTPLGRVVGGWTVLPPSSVIRPSVAS